MHADAQCNTRPCAQADLPAGELVIGVNPPFGFQNKTAIEFVEHALCAQPRLLVLIMPLTNYHPRGYELILRDVHPGRLPPQPPPRPLPHLIFLQIACRVPFWYF